MDPNQYLYDALSQLSGGLITDLKTLFLGGIVLAFILMGLDYLKTGFEHMMDRRAHGRFLESAEDMRMEREQYRRGSSEWEEANYMYRHFIGKAAKTRLRSWGE
jgi:hypothetical protein